MIIYLRSVLESWDLKNLFDVIIWYRQCLWRGLHYLKQFYQIVSIELFIFISYVKYNNHGQY